MSASVTLTKNQERASDSLIDNAVATVPVTIRETPAMQAANSFLEVFYAREQLHPNDVYLRQPEGEHWHTWTWQEVGQQARQIAAALHEMGLRKGDHVGILSKNCAQWLIADLAILMGGYISVPFYPTLRASELEEVITLGDVKALFIGKLEHWPDQAGGVPEGLPCIRFPHYSGNSEIDRGTAWEQIIAHTSPIAHAHQPEPNELFTIIFTSGTTGTPKGVMLTYANINAIMQHEREQPRYGIYQGVNERVISYLPLNHIAERVISEISTIVSGATVSFAESLDRFAPNLQSVQPTQFFAVPRIWIKMQQGILARLPQKKLDRLLAIPLVRGLIKKKIRQGLGLADVRAAISGAAPIPASVLKWFAKLDIEIQEVYGATELCGGVTYNALGETCPGSVGEPLPGVDIRIDPATNEVQVKAPWVMKAYYGDDEKTAEVFADGYYRTGDTGRFDAAGNLVISGRLKDTFKTAKGKFILPVPIEQQLGKHSAVEQVVVVGFGLNQPLALIKLSAEIMQRDASAGKHAMHEGLRKQFGELLDEINAKLENYARLSHLVLFEQGWEEGSELFTPTLKIKRHAVDALYAEHYTQWQQASDSVIFADDGIVTVGRCYGLRTPRQDPQCLAQ